ncbi:hypothetical protein GCM10017771_19780 [Streptomyces capitiformicae]|uniref:Uncharacterized protein n=1 Tax=Streptomyces capitiformicae TaxID=2014920 RepID=A0A919GKP3_9ACTN|nr:hypothetical protein GCM10017771_19780 [Streptomyces capitiformicae]
MKRLKGLRNPSPTEVETREVKFLLEVDLDSPDWDEGTTVLELERILRYWGGNLRHCEIKPGDGQPLYDSDHQQVGRWTVTSE